MTPSEFRAWMGKLNLSTRLAAKALGLHGDSIRNYRRGSRPSNPHVPIPAIVAKLCVELERRYDDGQDIAKEAQDARD